MDPHSFLTLGPWKVSEGLGESMAVLASPVASEMGEQGPGSPLGLGASARARRGEPQHCSGDTADMFQRQ